MEMAGQNISHYVILEKLGEGGMGVVYKARDTKLDRTVALKFLPQHLASSEADKSRFVQEAKAASSLNHPNVCTIHDIQEHAGQMFIVMEYIDGQTLREKQGSLTFKQAIDLGIQIADGLAAAHEKGIVHRDLKPDNIMVRKDGIAQIMDFGLAKLHGAVSKLTKEGSTVGTAGYMSPEQVQGQDVDHRSDIFSLGTLLYELFAGQLPFKGVHETALLYEIVNVDAAPMASLRPDIDPSLDAIVLECLEKDPRDRFQSAAEIGKDLRKFKRESTRQRVSRITGVRPVYPSPASASAGPEPLRKTSMALAAWIAAGLFLSTSAVLAILYWKTPAVEMPVLRSHIAPPEHVTFSSQNGGHIALSPDGKLLAFVGIDSLGKASLWVKPLNSFVARQLPGTGQPIYPFWSPDNKQIAFFADGKLKRIDAAGGPVLTICDARNGRGGTWNAAGIIVFAPDNAAALSKVSAAGGVPVQVTRLDTAKEDNHRFPLFLPDGDRFLYVSRVTGTGVATEKDNIMAASLSDTSLHELVLNASSNMELAAGYLLYYQQRNLMARPFDPDKIRFTGDGVPVAEEVLFGLARSKASFAASRTGVLLYQGGFSQRTRLTFVDRAGRELQTYVDAPLVGGGGLSNDGTQIAYSQEDPQFGTPDVWLYDLRRGVRTRLSFDRNGESSPLWSPDGRQIIYSWNRTGDLGLYIKSTVNADSARVLHETRAPAFATSWSPDGQWVLFTSIGDAETREDLYVISPTEGRRAAAVLRTEFSERMGKFSPDGRWIAYASNATGQFEIYIIPFPYPGDQPVQVSRAGGGIPRWRQDGKALYYISSKRDMVEVDIILEPGRLRIGQERELFDVDANGLSAGFDVTPDASKFLMWSARSGVSQPIMMVTNWHLELDKR